MVILIGGATHTGKTMLAQKLVERYRLPCTSLDHIKMGLVRSGLDCGFKATDGDDFIAERLWGVVKGIIDTCLENGQSIILEGCYLPQKQAAKYVKQGVLAVYLGLSPQYIRSNFSLICEKESVIERRRCTDITAEELLCANALCRERCAECSLPYFEICSDYEQELPAVFDYIDDRMPKKPEQPECEAES